MQSGRLPGRLGQPLNLLGINQAAVSKMERRADMYISTLQSMIRAMGGQLKIEAVFPDGKRLERIERRIEAVDPA